MKSQTQRVQRHDKWMRALEMRKMRMSYSDIATLLGVSTSTARNMIVRALEITVKDSAAELVQIECESLDKLESRLWANATDPAYVDRILKIKDFRARLLGLYAPTRTEQSGPNGQPIQIERVFNHDRVIAELAPGPIPNPDESGDD